MYDILFTAQKIGKIRIKNRFVMPAMNSNLHDKTHHFNSQAKYYYAERAKGGYGLLITEFLCVSKEGLAGTTQAAIYDDCFIETLKEIVDEVHKYDAKIFAQLHHAGRVAKTGDPDLAVVSSFWMPLKPNGLKVHMLSIDEIKEVEQKFVDAALRAKKAGFDGVEIHGAHGYLLDQFLDKAINKRTDIYGGSITNRSRIVVEIIKEIKKACGDDYPISVRINGQSTLKNGNTIEEAAAQALLMEKAGADVINVSYGTAIQTYYKDSGFNMNNVKKVKDILSIPVIGVGRINEPNLALEAVYGEYMDFVATGRQSIADPHFPNKIYEGRIDEIIMCTGCTQRCLYKDSFEEGFGVSCMNNPFSGKENLWNITETENPKKIAVIGGGPAGLQAAWILAKRKHNVTLYEKNNILGGQYTLACVPPMKSGLAKTIATLQIFAKKYGVDIKMNVAADKKLLEEKGFDIVIDATGSIPVIPRIPGIDNKNVCTAQDVLRFDKQFMNNKLLVLGAGLVGGETAELLSEQGNLVTLVDMIDTIAPLAPMNVRNELVKRLDNNGVIFINKSKVVSINEDGIVYEKEGINNELSGFDGIVLAFGSRSNSVLKNEYEGLDNYYSIGDSLKAGDAKKAIFEATKLAIEL